MLVMQLVMQNVERSLGPLETIIDSEYWQTMPLQTRRPQRGAATEGRKQKKVQNWRERLMRWRHMSDDDSPRQALESNALRSLS